jgi:hypothetical protein
MLQNRLIALIGAFTTLLTLPTNAAAFSDTHFPDQYSPRLTAPQFKPFALTACVEIPDKRDAPVGANYQCQNSKVSYQPQREDGPWQVNLSALGGEHRHAGKRDDLGGFLDSVHSADFNQDGRPDYLLEFGSHGNGLAAAFRTLAFLVSRADGFDYIMFENVLTPAKHQLVQATGGGPAIVQLGRRASDFVSGPIKARDGKPHTFFVFDAIQFEKDSAKLSLANSAAVGLPRWVLYTENANTAATTLISAQDQARLWRSPLVASKRTAMQRK